MSIVSSINFILELILFIACIMTNFNQRILKMLSNFLIYSMMLYIYT